MPLDIASSPDNSRALVAARAAAITSRRPRASQARNDDGQFLSVEKLRKQYIDYLTAKQEEIDEQKESRRYYHGAQYNADQLKVLKDRGQPPLTYNHTSRKINCIVGLIERMRSDPKALPNSPKFEAGTELATEGIRSVLNGNDWKTRDEECLRRCGFAAIAGIELRPYRNAKGEMNLKLKEVLDDEYFYDPKSVLYDFDDKRYEGIAKWMDVEAAIELFPEQEETLRDLIENGSDLTTNADREFKWISTQSQRLRLVEHWYRHRGKWCYAFYVANTLLDEGVSPFRDEEGNTVSRFIMFSAAVDHDGDRYSFVRNLKGAQDSLNQSKSKALHVANSRRVISEKGAVDDVETARREWVRPDGWVEVNPGFGDKIQPDQTQQDLASFMKFAEEAKQEIDEAYNINVANLQGVTGVGQLSGRAIELLRQPGMAELGPFVIAYRGWKLRVYRAIFNFIKLYWKEERWIRISDDEQGKAQFLQINALGMDPFGQPAIVNAIGELDVDIAMEEGPDVGNLMQDTYDALKGYPPGTFPPQVLIELSPLPRSHKNRILQMLSPPPQPPDPAADLAKRLSLEQIDATNAALRAEAANKQANAAKTAAQVEQVQADAALKHSAVITNAAKAAESAMKAQLAPAQFALDAMAAAREPGSERPAPSGPLPLPPVMQPEGQFQLPL